MDLKARIMSVLRLDRRRVKLEIICTHGEFIPAAYRPGPTPRRYGCPDCGVKVRLSTFRGPVTW